MRYIRVRTMKHGAGRCVSNKPGRYVLTNPEKSKSCRGWYQLLRKCVFRLNEASLDPR